MEHSRCLASVTTNERQYVCAWKLLTHTIADRLGLQVHSFDPHVVLSDPATGGIAADLKASVAVRLYKILAGKDLDEGGCS